MTPTPPSDPRRQQAQEEAHDLWEQWARDWFRTDAPSRLESVADLKTRVALALLQARDAGIREAITTAEKHCVYLGRCNSDRCVAHQVVAELRSLLVEVKADG